MSSIGARSPALETATSRDMVCLARTRSHGFANAMRDFLNRTSHTTDLRRDLGAHDFLGSLLHAASDIRCYLLSSAADLRLDLLDRVLTRSGLASHNLLRRDLLRDGFLGGGFLSDGFLGDGLRRNGFLSDDLLGCGLRLRYGFLRHRLLNDGLLHRRLLDGRLLDGRLLRRRLACNCHALVIS